MSESLTGTVALVTGASSGIGAATATRLAALGATVALVARRRERIDAVAAEIAAAGGQTVVVEADITDEIQARAAVETTVAELGRLDTLVNNAGVMLIGPAVDAPLPEWQQMVQVNTLGLLYVSHAALPHLLAAADREPRRVADLVNISSTAGRITRPGTAVYNATKHAVTGFSDALRQEVNTRHVRVSMVEPGATTTELTSHLRSEIRAAVTRSIDDTRLLDAEDIADAVAYIVTRRRHVAVNEILVRPTEQVG